MESIETLKQILEEFKCFTRLKINYDKSELLCINTPRTKRNQEKNRFRPMLFKFQIFGNLDNKKYKATSLQELLKSIQFYKGKKIKMEKIKFHIIGKNSKSPYPTKTSISISKYPSAIANEKDNNGIADWKNVFQGKVNP